MEATWCLIGLAASFVLMAVAVITVHRPHVPHMNPGHMLRGCIALSFILLALALVGLILLLRYQ